MTDVTPASSIDVYQRDGEAWAKRRGDTLVEHAWLDRFCALLPVGGTVLDIGCGSGLPIGREMIRRGFDVTGVDGTPTMISLFRRNLPDSPARLMDVRQLDLGRRFQGCWRGTVSSTSRPTISVPCSHGSGPMLPRAPR